jgi:hypothetical protein
VAVGFGTNQSITGSAIARALAPDDAEAAGRLEAAAERAVLDEQELRHLEHAEYYNDSTEPSGPTTPAVSGARGVRGLILRVTGGLRRRG